MGRKPDSVEALYQMMPDSGWHEFLKATGPDAAAALPDPETVRAAELARALFADGAGADFLAWLKSITLERVSYPGDLGLSMDVITAHGLYRDGQNHIVHLIGHLMEEGRKLEETADDTSS